MSYNFSYFKGSNNQSPSWDQRNTKFDQIRQSRTSFPQNLNVPSSNRSQDVQGVVTQLFSSFGYINDNIIFSKTDVVGPMVQKGDEVSVFASYQPNNPTKYKGERVCKIEQSRFSSNSTPNLAKMKTLSQGMSSRVGPAVTNRIDNKNGAPTQGPRFSGSIKNRLASKNDQINRAVANLAEFRRSVALKEKKSSTKEVKTNVTTDKEKEKPQTVENKVDKRQKFDNARKGEVTKRKADSPIKSYAEPKVAKPIAAPVIESIGKIIPKYYESFAHRELDCATVKNQFQNLKLPKEFFHASLKYQHSFPLNHPMKLGNNCQFKVMDKKVKCIEPSTEDMLNKDIDPDDADSTFVAKVMLLSIDDLAKFYKDTLVLAEEFDGTTKVPITKAIKFLVASVGQKNEFAIGGSWSPSLDGQDPETNPQVLINTAIRTCKSITGIDLSQCTTWPKFLELHYYRPLQEIKKTKSGENDDGNVVIDVDAPEEPSEIREPRMETVVYYVPDVWNCMPSSDNWSEITRLYLEQLTCIMCPPPARPVPVSAPKTPSSPAPPTKVAGNDEEKSANRESDHVEEEDWNENEMADEVAKTSEVSSSVDQPTHFSKLVVTGMKIVDIKRELELRKLNNRGVMEQLKARLKAALDREEAEDRNKDNVSVTVSAVTTPSLPKCLLSETEKNELKKLYILPDQPGIIVHPNKKIFNGNLDVHYVSLKSLLSNLQTDVFEATFELIIFARQFMEMLRRDAVFNIYKSIVVAQESDLIMNNDSSGKKGKAMVTTSKRTINRPLLFSCTLLDQGNTGKIYLEDLEVLIEGLGISLSSDQLSSILDKVKDNSKYLNYRQLTDKEVSDSDIDNMMNMDMSEDLDYIKELAMGNKALFDSGTSQMEILINDDDTERLKNQLDRSERCRQMIELKVAEIKEETERNFKLAQSQSKEVGKWKEQATEFKAMYDIEHGLCERYKRDFERLKRQLKDMGKMSLSLNTMVDNALLKLLDSEVNTPSKDSQSVLVEQVREDIVMDLTEDSENVDNKVVTIDLDDKVEQKEGDVMDTEQDLPPMTAAPQSTNVTPEEVQPAVVAPMEDFDLVKPSDFDEIQLEWTD